MAEQVVHKQGGGIISAKGAQAGKAFDSDEQVKAKRKADAYRTKFRKSFAWKAPSKAGVDPDYDAFDPDKMEAPKEKETPKGLSSLAKK
jgi:hypothetical protein